MKSFFGHPPGLATLFFTEMWERFSYYGGRAMLILYMTAAVVGENPGLGLTVMEAGALYGLYTAVVYMTNLPGGWIADKFIGARNAVFYGGCIIALGNLMLAAPFGLPSFYSGLGLIAIGTGLLKPNVSTMVGSLYGQGDVRRDSAFSIFYMGINLGAFLAPLIAGYFGQNVNWRTGFLVVAIGMVLGLIQYKLGAKHLGDAGKLVRSGVPGEHEKQLKGLRNGFFGILIASLLLTILHFTGLFKMSVINVSNLVGVLLLVVPFVYFGTLFGIFSLKGRTSRLNYFISISIYSILNVLFFRNTENNSEDIFLVIILSLPIVWASIATGVRRCHDINKSGWYILIPLYGLVLLFAPGDRDSNKYGSPSSLGATSSNSSDFSLLEKNRIVAIIIFYLAAALFWAAFEQAGSTLTLFADRNTHNSFLGMEFPSTWWQSINALFIIVLSGVFAWLWLKLNKMKMEPSTPMKFAIGLLLVGVGFLILVPAAIIIEKTGNRVGIHWLLMLYFIHTVGELFLSPVGLSAMTKLAPARIVGQMMGIWFLGAATGNFIGGRVGGMFESFPLKNIFLAIFIFSLVASLVMFLLVPWMKRLMGEVK